MKFTKEVSVCIVAAALSLMTESSLDTSTYMATSLKLKLSVTSDAKPGKYYYTTDEANRKCREVEYGLPESQVELPFPFDFKSCVNHFQQQEYPMEVILDEVSSTSTVTEGASEPEDPNPELLQKKPAATAKPLRQKLVETKEKQEKGQALLSQIATAAAGKVSAIRQQRAERRHRQLIQQSERVIEPFQMRDGYGSFNEQYDSWKVRSRKISREAEVAYSKLNNLKLPRSGHDCESPSGLCVGLIIGTILLIAGAIVGGLMIDEHNRTHY